MCSFVSGGLGILNDGDTSKFLRWSPSSHPILILFGFDSIKEFRAIDFNVKCPFISSQTCNLVIKIGVFETVKLTNHWTNQFRPITIHRNQQDDDTTLVHLILTVEQMRGQFVIIQILANEGLAISEVTFDNRNEFDGEFLDIWPSSIYVENNLLRLESSMLKSTTISTSTGKKTLSDLC